MNKTVITGVLTLLMPLCVSAATPDVAAPFMNAVGEPSDKTVAFSARWNDDNGALDNLTELVYVDGTKSAGEIIALVLEHDPRFYAAVTDDDAAVAYGFDTNGDNSRAVYADGVKQPESATTGYFTIGSADLETVTPASVYDHWQINTSEARWMTFVNGEAATAETPVAPGDALVLEYLPAGSVAPSEPAYTFYLRPADLQGVWILDDVTIDTADGKQKMVPMIANVLGDGAALYGVGISAECIAADCATTSTAYAGYVADAKKGAVTCRVTVNSPAEAYVRPYLNIRKNWGDGKMSVRRIYGNDAHVNTVVAHPVTGIFIEGYEPGATIEIANMGTAVMRIGYEPENADFKTSKFAVGDESIVSVYTSNPNYIVAHTAGSTTITVSSADGTVSTTYNVAVADIDPSDKPDDDFQDGLVWLNEEWFTHTSGSLNYIDADGKIYYRAYGNQNGNMAFGATSQYAMIYADKLFVMSKQAWDGGDKRPVKSGGRVVVADAKTMKHIAAFDEIGGDGRACVGVSPRKVYLSHSKGIRVMHLDDEITIENADIEGSAPARNGQIGNMVKAGRYVFAVGVGSSLLIIDTETDKIVENIAVSGIQTVARTLDGRVWIGCAKTLQPIDPETLELGEVLTIGDGTIGCSSGSWRSGNLIASNKTNTLFWSNGNWNGSGGALIRWDIDEVEDPSTLKAIYTHDNTAGIGTQGYGTPAYDSRTDTWMYATNTGFGVNSLQNWLIFVDATSGKLKHSIKTSEYFWFPAMPVMPDKYEPDFKDFEETLNLVVGDDPVAIELVAVDEDNLDCAIAVTLLDGDEAEEGIADDVDLDAVPAKAVLSGRTLTVAPLGEGSRTLHFELESNGKVVNKEMTVNVKESTGIVGVGVEDDASSVYYRTDGVRIDGRPSAPGVYLEKTGNKVRKIVL